MTIAIIGLLILASNVCVAKDIPRKVSFLSIGGHSAWQDFPVYRFKGELYFPLNKSFMNVVGLGIVQKKTSIYISYRPLSSSRAKYIKIGRRNSIKLAKTRYISGKTLKGIGLFIEFWKDSRSSMYVSMNSPYLYSKDTSADFYRYSMNLGAKRRNDSVAATPSPTLPNAAQIRPVNRRRGRARGSAVARTRPPQLPAVAREVYKRIPKPGKAHIVVGKIASNKAVSAQTPHVESLHEEQKTEEQEEIRTEEATQTSVIAETVSGEREANASGEIAPEQPAAKESVENKEEIANKPVVEDHFTEEPSTPIIDLMARVYSVKGKMLVKSGGADWRLAEKGDLVRSGDELRTESDSTALVHWGQDNYVAVTGGTQVVFRKMSMLPAKKTESLSAELSSGKIYAQVNSSSGAVSNMKVKAPGLYVSTREGAMSVSSDAKDVTQVECLSGTVSLSTGGGGEQALESGQKTSYSKSGIPEEPTALSSLDRMNFGVLQSSVPPSVEVYWPVGDMSTETAILPIRGRTDVGNFVLVNGKRVEPGKDGFFASSIDLEAGKNDLEIKVVDPKNDQNSIKNYEITRENETAFSRTVEGVSPRNEKKTFVLNRPDARNETDTKEEPADSKAPRLIITHPSGSTFDPTAGDCVPTGGIYHCLITGQTEPGAILTINDVQFPIDVDGSFAQTVSITDQAVLIRISSAFPEGQTSTVPIKRRGGAGGVEFIELRVTPASLVANGANTANITVTTRNLSMIPVSATVLLFSSSGGVVTPSSLTTGADGTGNATFTSGLETESKTVTITARSGLKTGTTTLLLLPSSVVPPHP